jgi:hypothetical protein
LIWGTFLGGSAFERGYGLAVDEWCNAIVTGSTSSFDFPTTPGAYDTTLGSESNDDAFITVIAPAGDTLIWSSYLGGTGVDRGYAVTLDSQGSPVLTGPTYSSDFPTTPCAYDSTFNGGVTDVFMACLDISATSGIGPGGRTAAPLLVCGGVPNPFRGRTTMRFFVPEGEHASLAIFDVSGRLVRTLADGTPSPGAQSRVWDSLDDRGMPVEPGVYFCRVEVRGRAAVSKMVFLK